MSANSTSPPSSPRRRTSVSRISHNIYNALIQIRRVRQDKQIVSTSGLEPITHPCLSNVVPTHKISVSREDQFVCVYAVDVPKLLRACRSTLLEDARTIGANTLVEEQWSTTITQKNRAGGPYKVQVQYSATAARSDGRDPERPVALDKSLSVPGLMTIIKRGQ